jgi:GntR family transcriptional regulator/MocR family aminotransferase
MAQGHFARHIRRMRTLYAERRAALAAALDQIFDGKLNIELQAGGMHLIARCAQFKNDRLLVARAKAHSLHPAALSRWGIERGPQDQGLLLGFTNTPQSAAFEVALRLKQAIGA